MIVCLSASHKKAKVTLLESLAFKDLKRALGRLYRLKLVKGCAIIQTCNRVELFAVVEGVTSRKALDELTSFWSQQSGVSLDIIIEAIDAFYGNEALKHLLSLSAGLESMVVGEDQILGQVRSAYNLAKNAGTIGEYLDSSFMKAVNVGRRIKTETALNEGSLSISSIAVKLAEEHVRSLEEAVVLVIGAGEAGAIAARELSDKNAGRIIIANRTYARGAKLAAEIGGESIRLKEIYSFLRQANIVIVAASAAKPLITFRKAKESLYGVPNKQLFLDISQPRCVEESVGKLGSVQLRNIDDLKAMADENTKKRMEEYKRANEIIAEELGHLQILLRKKISEPTIARLCKGAEEIRRRELLKAMRMMRDISEESRDTIEALTKVLVERILQTPIENLRAAALNGDNGLLEATEKVFSLKTESKGN